MLTRLRNSNSSHRKGRSSHRRCSLKHVFFKNSQTLQENTCVEDFVNKVAGLQPASFLKRDSNTSVFCEVWETFKNTYFEELLQTTASGDVL